jgi:hypothetical protein
MGNHADAKLAWGIDFGDPENTMEGYSWREAGIDRWDFEEEVMPVLFGFTEEPPDRPDGVDQREWWAAFRKPYNQRRDAAIPLKFERYSYEGGGTALVLKRSLAHVEWGAEAVDPATLAAPTTEEVAAFGNVISRLGWHDAGPVKLLLMAFYG